MFRFQLDMICTGAVTALARDPNIQAPSVVPIGARIVGKRSNVCRVAFQARWIYSTGELRCTVNVTWAVDPSVSVGPITHWKLKEPVSLPVEVGLASRSRSSDQIDPLSSQIGRASCRERV